MSDQVRTPTVDYYVDDAGGHRFRVKAPNGEIIASSEAYASASNAKRGFEALTNSILVLAGMNSAKASDQPIRSLPELPQRLETGRVRFGDDWTGVFIRGDNAYAYATAIKAVRNHALSPLHDQIVDGLAALLESSNENPA